MKSEAKKDGVEDNIAKYDGECSMQSAAIVSVDLVIDAKFTAILCFLDCIK